MIHYKRGYIFPFSEHGFFFLISEASEGSYDEQGPIERIFEVADSWSRAVSMDECGQAAICEAHANNRDYGLIALPILFFFPGWACIYILINTTTLWFFFTKQSIFQYTSMVYTIKSDICYYCIIINVSWLFKQVIFCNKTLCNPIKIVPIYFPSKICLYTN